MEIIDIIVQGLGSLLVAGTLYYAARQLKQSHESQKQNHDWNRRNAAQIATLEYTVHNDGSTILNRALKYTTAKEPIPLDHIINKFKEDEELRIICHRLLNYYESLSVGVIQGVYDESVIKAIRKSPMKLLFKNFKNYIDYMRKEYQPTAYEQQERLLTKWDAEDNNLRYRNPTA